MWEIQCVLRVWDLVLVSNLYSELALSARLVFGICVKRHADRRGAAKISEVRKKKRGYDALSIMGDMRLRLTASAIFVCNAERFLSGYVIV